MSDESALERRARLRAYEARLRAGELAPDCRVGIAATFTAEALAPFLSDGLLTAGRAPALRLAPYGQLIQSCLDPDSAFGPAAELQAVVLLWRMEELLAAEIEAFLAGDSEGGFAGVEQRLGELVQALRALRTAFQGTIVVSLPPFPERPEADLLHPRNVQRLGALHAFTLQRWRALVAALDESGLRVSAFDLDALQRHFGAARASDARKWYLYRQPYREEFLALLGRQLAELLALARGQRHKCAILDCDNTLWGGVVGEEGVDGVAIGDDFPGSAFRDFQRLLREWRRGGTLLALLSKNDERAVFEVFERRPEMVLRREDVAAWAVNWRPKAENLPAIVEALRIAPDQMVFFDDDPREIAAMKAAWPAMECVQIPDDPARIVGSVRERGLFHAVAVTEEDRQRTGMLLADRERDALRAQLSQQEFLASLQLRVRVSSAAASDVARVAQLVNRTNQFNLTTLRRSAEEIEALRSAERWRVLALAASDRFGDYGTTGVAIVETQAGQWRLDTFLLSCRVLGRGIETALLAVIAQEAHAAGVRRLLARFVPTAKNAAAADFLPRHGFSQGATGEWEAAPDATPAMPGHVALLSAAP